MMEVTIPVGVVKELITGMGKVVTSRATIPHFTSLWIQPQKKGVQVFATSGDEFVLYNCPEAVCNGKEGFPLNFMELRAFMREIRGESVTIRVMSKEVEFRFQEDLWSATVTAQKPEMDEPHVDIKEMFGKWKLVDAGSFLDDYEFGLPFASRDETRYILNGVCFAQSGDIAATDGRRLVMKEGGHKLKIPVTPQSKVAGIEVPSKKDLVVPCNAFLRWPKAGDIAGIEITDKHEIRMERGRWQHVLRCIDGNFPNYHQVIPKPTPDGFFELGDNAVDAFKFVQSVMSAKEAPCVRIEPLKTKAKIVLNAQDHRENRKVKVDVDGCGDGTIKFVTGVNATYFIQALQRGFRKFHQADALSPTVSFHDGWTHVLMPMRVE